MSFKKIFSLFNYKHLSFSFQTFIKRKKYTHNWGDAFSETTKILKLKNLELALEIGCFEGLTSNYIVDNILDKKNGKLICVDPLSDDYLGSNPMKKRLPYFNAQYDKFIYNTKKNKKQIKLIRKKSSDSFKELLPTYKNSFDLIYIDGDHRASAVYNDAINSFELCKNKGVIIFDDYNGGGDYLEEEATKYGVNEFLKRFEGRYEILLINSQIAIRKNET